MPSAKSTLSFVTLTDKVKCSENAISFLKEHGILNSSANCKKCFRELTTMKRLNNSAYWYFHCQLCDTKVSIRDRTILSHSHIGIRTFCLLLYTFVMFQGLTVSQKIHEVGVKSIKLHFHLQF